MDERTLKVSWAIYKQVGDYANAEGLSLKESVDFLLDRALQADGAEDQDSSGLLDVLREYLPQSIDSPEALRGVLEKLLEAWKFYQVAQNMFPCVICQKPLQWNHSNEGFGKALKEAVAHWKHGDCGKETL